MRKKKTETLPAPEQGAVQPAIAETQEARHHPCGPSKWPALLECPCFESRPATEDTQRGTELHALFEAVMNGTYEGEPADAMEYHVVNAATEFLKSANTGRFYVEQEVELPPPNDSPRTRSEFHGRLDLAWLDKSSGDLHVVDLKLSENPDRDHRPQLLAYAAGMMWLVKYTPRLIYLHMVYADTGDTTQEIVPGDEAWTEYNANYRRIEFIWKEQQTNPMKPRQCGFCDLCAKFAACSAVRAVVERATPRLADAAKPEVWADYSAERKAQVCALADMLSKWCTAVKENAAADAKAGLVIQDEAHGIYYTTQERKGRLVIPDVQHAWNILKAHLTAEGYRACLTANLSGLTAALKLTGLKPVEVNAMLERCGVRLPSTTVFVRRGLKESA